MAQAGAEEPNAITERSLLAAIVECSDDAIVSFDRAGRITSWNRGAELLYGVPASVALGRHIELVFPSRDDAEDLLRRILGGERIEHAEVRRRRNDGSTVMVGETASPLRDADGEVVGAATVGHDVGARRQVQAELEAAQAALEAKNVLLARSNTELEQFAYVASHDLSEPLRAVAGMVGLLSRRYKGQLDDDADEFIAFAMDGCERMRAMIEDLLAFSRAGRAELRVRRVALAEVVELAVAGLGPQIEGAGATVELGALPEVHADGNQLRQVLQNLISNSIKFRREGLPPVIRITAAPVPSEPAWKVSVTDNGIGVEEQYHGRIFRMFQRLHPADAYPGTGIGLAISERIVERHGGTMGVSSEGASGSTFWFTLPAEPAVAG